MNYLKRVAGGAPSRLLLAFLAGLVASSWAHSQGDSVDSMLRRNDVTALETFLGRIQARFEDGSLSEIDLRNAYRPFYTLDANAANNLRRWAAHSPKSYPAHLALGIYLKKLGRAARGGDFVQMTAEEKLAQMKHYFGLAESELRRSLPLTAKPYLSVFHLMDISTYEGDRPWSKELLLQANRLLPANSLARGRYVTSLMPRWGGSYEEVDAFIKDAKSEGVPGRVIWQLEAIEADDLGHTYEERGDQAEAQAQFTKALQLGMRVGGSFSSDFLPVSRYYVCSVANRAPYCQ